MNPTGTVTHAARRAVTAEQALGAVQRAERSSDRAIETVGIQSEAVLRSALEHLTEPVFLFEPVFDGERIVDLRLVETNPAGRAATRTSCPPGVLASDLYVEPGLAMAAAQRAWDGLADVPYEIVRPGVDETARDSVYRITTLRAGSHVMQVVHDRTSEHELAAAEERFRLTADLLAQPLHLHRPIFDHSGALVDTEILFANRVAEAMDNVGVPHVGRRASEIIRDPTGSGLRLYRDAWNDPDGLVHRMSFDNLDRKWPDRPFAYLEVQARRVGDMIATVAVDRTETELATRHATSVGEQLAAMFDTMSEGVLVIAPDGEFLAANQAAASMAGLASAQELVGLHYGDIPLEVLSADGVPVEHAERRRAVENGQMLDGLMGVLRRPDGTEIRLVFTSRAFRLADGRQGTLL
ncbi:MAG: fold, partial [Actinomycetota bacterium]